MEIKKIHTNHKEVSFDKENQELHQKDFGFNVPKDFFENSRNSILEQTVRKSKKRQVVKLVSLFTSVAAALLLFMSIVNSDKKESQFSLNDEESELIIIALLEDDGQLNELADAYMLDDLYLVDNTLN